MKFVCLGYIEAGKFESMPEGERNAMVDSCFAYDDVLRENGHFAGGEGLLPASSAVTLRFQNGKVTATDGPYAETKEQIGGILILEGQRSRPCRRADVETPRRAHGPLRDPPGGGLDRNDPRQRAATRKTVMVNNDNNWTWAVSRRSIAVFQPDRQSQREWQLNLW
jgi:hypothetical protein